MWILNIMEVDSHHDRTEYGPVTESLMSSKLLSEKDWNQLVKKRAHGFQIKLKMDKTSSYLRYIIFVAYCEPHQAHHDS